MSQYRVALADGGLYDNLGTSVFDSGRDEGVSYNVFDTPFVIACDAGHGQAASDRSVPHFWPNRIIRAVDTMFRRNSNLARARLHEMRRVGDIEAFLLPYLGMQDYLSPPWPSEKATRVSVTRVGTNFGSMSPEMIKLLTSRGEQVTRALVASYGIAFI